MRGIYTITFLMVAGACLLLAGGVSAYELDWSIVYLVENTAVGAMSIGCDSDGKYWALYVDDTDDVLDSYRHAANYGDNFEVDSLESPQYAYNDIDFALGFPIACYYDFYSNRILVNSFVGSSWGSAQPIPDSNGARDVRLDTHNNAYHVAFCYEQPGTDNCYLRYIQNDGGTWIMEEIERISRVGVHRMFDMKIDSSGVPHFVWWDHHTAKIRHAVRTGDDTYVIEDAYDDPVSCQWIKLDIIDPDLPFISFLDSTGATSTLRIAYELGDWYTMNVFTNPNITALDSVVSPSATLTSQDYYFILSLTTGYYSLNNEPGGWQLYPISILSSRPPAESLKTAWKPGANEFGVVFDLEGEDKSIFLKAVPVHPTPTPTSPPPPTPTTGPGTPTNTPLAPTPTPGPCTDLGVTISMPSDMFLPGDVCYCSITICNPDAVTYNNTPVFMFLDVYGVYFFAPSFSDFDHYTMDVTPGSHVIDVLPSFAWPGGVGSASGIRFYAGMTDPGISELLGDFDIFEFGWSG